MDPMTTLGQIFEATASDLCLLDAAIKSLLKEFAAGALTENNNGKPPPELLPTIIQKYRQMTILFMVKLLNHLVVVNTLKVPCLSCGASLQSSPQSSLLAPNLIETKPPQNTSASQLRAPVLTAAADARLNLPGLTTDTMAAISPLLAAAAALTPPSSGGTCSTDSSSLLATVPRANDHEQATDASNNTAHQYLLAQQKLAALVQLHQQQQQRQSAPVQLPPVVPDTFDKERTTSNAMNEDSSSSEANFDEDEEVNAADDEVDSNAGDGRHRPIEVAIDDQPIDFSSSSHHQKFATAVDENRPPLSSSSTSNPTPRQPSVSGPAVGCQQLPASSSALSLVPQAASAVNSPIASIQGASSAFLSNPSTALSDALGRVVNRLPVTNPVAAAAAVGNMFGSLACQTNANDLTSAYAKFHSAIASAVSSNHRASIGSAAAAIKTHELSNPVASPFAALAQHLFPGGANTGGNAGLLSPVTGLIQKAASSSAQSSAATISPTETMPMCSVAGPCSQPPGPTHSALANRRASLPPYMLSSQTSQQHAASLVSPGANSSSGGGHHGNAGVRTADRYRVVYTSSQTFELEQEYRQNKFITITRKKELARQLGLNERQVKIWFQNRRAKDKRAHRRGAESASGGETSGDLTVGSHPSSSKKSKNALAIKQEQDYVDGSAASVGSSGSSTGVVMNQHDANSNSNNSYDGSVQAQHESGGAGDDSDDCDSDSGDMNEEDELEEQDHNQQSSQQPPQGSIVYPTAVRYNCSGSVSSSSSSLSSTSHQLQNHHLSGSSSLLQAAHQGVAANALPSLLLATGGSQSNVTSVGIPPMVVSGNATAMEI